MKAYLRSARIAPKKANLIAKMVRGMPVPAAAVALRRTNKKGARMIEELLKSAVANAEHNDKQDASVLVIKSIVVNQGTGYRRGTPMARGRLRPMVKFLSHISLTLGIADHTDGADTKAKSEKKASQGAKSKVQKAATSAGSKKGTTKSDSSASAVSSAS